MKGLIAEVVDGFSVNIERATIANSNYRKVLHTTKQLQLVLMSIPPKEDIGEETHSRTTQFIRVESGTGKAIIDGKEYDLQDGMSIIIPAPASHNIINTGDEDLKLYTIYSPPEHPSGTIQKTKQKDR
jgi:mannose-6-phosphate isomerase-like protein (cupin superfamily)